MDTKLEIRENLIKNLNKIPMTKRERKILEYRFGITNNNLYTLEATGKKFGISRERVRQIQEKAIETCKILDKGS